MLPNFLIIGAQKSGTSWLLAKLRQHPEVFMPEGEVHFFDKDYNFARGVAWYEGHFEGAEGYRAVGEKTPDYLWANGRGVEGHSADVHRNVHEVVPDARLIVSMRNPVERAISAVRHLVRTRRVSPLHPLDDLLVGDKRDLVRGHGVIEYGFYQRQIAAYLEYFDRDQMLFLILEEDIQRDSAAALRRVCRFLEIDPEFKFSALREGVNVARRSRVGMIAEHYLPVLGPLARRMDVVLPPDRARPSEEAVRELYSIYEEENERLFAFLGRRPRAWEPEASG